MDETRTPDDPRKRAVALVWAAGLVELCDLLIGLDLAVSALSDGHTLAKKRDLSVVKLCSNTLSSSKTSRSSGSVAMTRCHPSPLDKSSRPIGLMNTVQPCSLSGGDPAHGSGVSKVDRNTRTFLRSSSCLRHTDLVPEQHVFTTGSLAGHLTSVYDFRLPVGQSRCVKQLTAYTNMGREAMAVSHSDESCVTPTRNTGASPPHQERCTSPGPLLGIYAARRIPACIAARSDTVSAEEAVEFRGAEELGRQAAPISAGVTMGALTAGRHHGLVTRA
ncbi:unnamed protein product [Lota lota]